jgi:Arc/MetJ-type ribon-helix-helix transcriptional regulator
MDYPDNQANSTTIRIKKGQKKAIDEFLLTKEAEAAGFNSASDVVNAAVRDLLIRYGVIKIIEPLKEER